MPITETCGNCRYWYDTGRVEAGHKLGECCFNPPQLVMGPQQSAIQGRTNILQLGASPPAQANRPGCHEHDPVPIVNE